MRAIGSFLLLDQRISIHSGREKLPIEALPLGNYYCSWCSHLCFVLPEDKVSDEPPVFCDNCDFLFAQGVL